MKRFVLLIAMITCVFTSCRNADHSYSFDWSSDELGHWKICTDSGCDSVAALAKHSYSEPVESGDSVLYTCIICGYEKQEKNDINIHTHDFSSEYISDPLYHWSVCSICGEASERNAHVFGDYVVVVPPSSDSDGTAEYVCTLCGKYALVTLNALPEKMGEEAWADAFKFENLRVRELSKMGSLSTHSTVYSIDGDLVQVYDGSTTVYSRRTELAYFDFSGHYSAFSHYGGGTYRAESVEITADGDSYSLSNVMIQFNDGILETISYDVSFGAIFGNVSTAYEFYDWGMVEITPEYLTRDKLNVGLSLDKFSSDFSLIYQKYSTVSGMAEEVQLTVVNDIYICKYYANASLNDTVKGDSANVAQGILDDLNSVLAYIDCGDFIYESDYCDYTYVGDGTVIPGIGKLVRADIGIADDHITTLAFEFANGMTYYYSFDYN